MQNRTLRQLTAAGVIAAAYAALSLVLAPITFGPVQCRISEALTLLPVISPAAIWGSPSAAPSPTVWGPPPAPISSGSSISS